MKAIIPLLFLFSVCICKGQENTNQSKSSFNKFIKLTDGYSEIPESLILEHLGKEWIDKNDNCRHFSGDSFASFRIGEISFATVNFGRYGVCTETVLFSFDSNGRLISSLTINRACDQPLDEREYEGTSYKFISKGMIAIIDFKIVAIGEPESEDNFSGNETEEYKKYEFISILPDGNFSYLESTDYILINTKKPNFSKELLVEEKLKKYSRNELRILRNEIFARKGYIFKSDDLREYFKKFDWYKPTSKNVNDSLSLIEKLNVQIILKAEQKKNISTGKATIVLDGYFVRIDKQKLYNLVGSSRIKETKYIDSELAYRTTGFIGRNGLFLISTNMSTKEILQKFSKYMFLR